MQQDQGSEFGHTIDKTNGEAAPKSGWFKKPNKPLTLDHSWNTTKSINFRLPSVHWNQNNIAKAREPPRTFDELMITPTDLSAYVMNHLKIDNLTQEILVGPAFNLLKGSCKSIEDRVPTLWSPVKVDYDQYAMWGISPLGYLEEIIVQRDDQKLYKFMEGDFPRLNLSLWMFTRRVVILKRVEDLQLGVKSYQIRAYIIKPKIFRSDISKITPYTIYKNPQGIIYLDKYKRSRLMHSDELYKFYDRTLTFVRNVLYDIANLILNGNKVLKRKFGEVEQEYEPTTAEEKQDRRNEIKARGNL
ncbi:hypothetical protein Tco_0704094 [Tanacetum coccineum]|uniref:Uncharacterized protein n=1 Tax=Tanacetum coccineum TaxID=301880 RepID=A0ABQ4Y2N6_9ASTR